MANLYRKRPLLGDAGSHISPFADLETLDAAWMMIGGH